MFTPIVHNLHVTGTLGAGVVYTFTAAHDMTLHHVSAVASNDSAATLIVGTTSDTNAYLEEAAIGDSDVPVEFDKDDFVGGKPVQIRKGTVVKFTLDHDGDGGTAANDFSLVATFTPG